MPKHFATIQQAENFLLMYSPNKQSGQTYTLSRMTLLMQRLGNPQNDIPAIHVAGTSGKTSTSYFIRALLEAHGKKTGLTASPHIVSITERVQIGGEPLADEVFLEYLDEFIDLLGHWQDLQPTYFELLVAFAFWVFKKESVDYMVIEVGLGGLLDATNVIADSRKISVITPIGLDHTEVLGTTIEAIARQKAGIITHNSHVFSAHQEVTAARVITEVCKDTASKLSSTSVRIDLNKAAPLFQQANFALAITVVRFITARDQILPISKGVEDECIKKTPPGRFEVYSINNKTLILDGAHNPQKLAGFVESFDQLYPHESATWLLGLLAAPSEKIEACIEEINRKDDDYIFTRFTVGQDIKGRESVNPHDLAKFANVRTMNSVVETDINKALELLFASKKRTVVITGSLYLVSQLRSRIRLLL